jgi:hypothetical protein
MNFLTGLVYQVQQGCVLCRQRPQDIIHGGHHFIGADLDALLI